MGSNESSRPAPALTCSTTEVHQEEFTYLWTVSNFVTILQSTTCETLSSPIFHNGEGNRFSWQLILESCNPKSKRAKENSYLSLYLQACDRDNRNSVLNEYESVKNASVKINFELSLLSPDGQHYTKSSAKEVNLRRYERFGFSEFIKIEKVPNFIKDDAIMIQVKIYLTDPSQNRVLDNCVRTSLKRKRSPDDEVKRQTDLYKNDFKKLKLSPVDSDLIIQTRTNKVFRVHKVILRCRSIVFEKLFQSSEWTDGENAIEIPFFSDDVVEGMLDYIYVGAVNNVKKKMLDYYSIAEEYELIGLKEIAIAEIMDALSPKNAVEILLKAYHYKNTPLMKDIITYINKNKKAVKLTDAFKELKDPDVLLDLYSSDSNN